MGLSAFFPLPHLDAYMWLSSGVDNFSIGIPSRRRPFTSPRLSRIFYERDQRNVLAQCRVVLLAM